MHLSVINSLEVIKSQVVQKRCRQLIARLRWSKFVVMFSPSYDQVEPNVKDASVFMKKKKSLHNILISPVASARSHFIATPLTAYIFFFILALNYFTFKWNLSATSPRYCLAPAYNSSILSWYIFVTMGRLSFMVGPAVSKNRQNKQMKRYSVWVLRLKGCLEAGDSILTEQTRQECCLVRHCEARLIKKKKW